MLESPGAKFAVNYIRWDELSKYAIATNACTIATRRTYVASLTPELAQVTIGHLAF